MEVIVKETKLKYIDSEKVSREISGMAEGDILEIKHNYFESGSIQTTRFMKLTVLHGAKLEFLNLETLQVHRVDSLYTVNGLPVKNIVSYGVYDNKSVKMILTNLIEF